MDSWESLAKLHRNVSIGGSFIPPCIPVQRVAIIIPYKNRQDSLKVLLNNLHPYLQRQQAHYRVFVSEPVSIGVVVVVAVLVVVVVVVMLAMWLVVVVAMVMGVM